jgi:hypothetical protein
MPYLKRRMGETSAAQAGRDELTGGEDARDDRVRVDLARGHGEVAADRLSAVKYARLEEMLRDKLGCVLC